jgi:hypothetical protein
MEEDASGKVDLVSWRVEVLVCEKISGEWGEMWVDVGRVGIYVREFLLPNEPSKIGGL